MTLQKILSTTLLFLSFSTMVLAQESAQKIQIYEATILRVVDGDTVLHPKSETLK